MKPRVRQWHDIVGPYRDGAWTECARLARAHLDRDPYDLSTRALLASLLVRGRQRAFALMHYERLLPLAVGRGDLFRAIATQRRLDGMVSFAQRHPDRYRAIQEWFRALAGSRERQADHESSGQLPPGALLALPPESFTAVAEQSAVVPLDLEPRAIHEPAGVLWVVYFGRVQWAIVSNHDAARAEFTAEEGDLIHLPPGDPEARWLEVEAELPSEVIQFEPGIVTLLDRARRTDLAAHAGGPAAAAPGSISDEAGPPPAAASAHAGVDPAPARAPGERPAPPAPASAFAAAAAPATPGPGPLAGPAAAVGAPEEGRREPRMAVLLETRAVLLHEAGTRSAPLEGRIVDLSSHGLGLAFRAAPLRQSAAIRPHALVSLEVSLGPGGEPVQVAGRIAWIEFATLADPGGNEEAHVGLEYVSLSAESRSRLIHLLGTADRPDP